MNCPKCGTEATEQSVYCHKCGERLDLPDEDFTSEDRAPAEPASEAASAGEPPDQPPVQPTPAPAERFQEMAAARQGREDEPEEELWQGRYSWKAMIRAGALSVLITVALVVLAIWLWNRYVTWPVVVLVLLLWLYQFFVMKYRQWSVRYRLTSQRFIHETGILRRVTDRIEVIDMDDITFEQALLERFVGVGTIRITSSDRTHPELLLLGIENVKEVAGKIDDNRRSERRRRGLHIESI
ncbi:MAG: PH domain-containing protein [Planctomycetota bacterium]|jgi:membrane protein YdbS with pleckstrin-like domain